MSASDYQNPGPEPGSGPTPTPTPPRWRGCFGTIISGGCGCTAFLVGAALAIALAAPQLLSGVAADGMERHLESRISADVEIYDLELHWTEFQRARRVTVHTLPGADGEKGESLAEFSLRLPSLIDLLAESSTEWFFKVTDGKFTARVDADGTSDLGRSLGLEAPDGRTELVALLGVLGEVTATIDDGESKELEERSVRTVMNSSSVRFIDMESGTGTDRAEATLSDFFLSATKSRVGYQVELKEAVVKHSVDQEANVSFELNFSGLEEQGPDGESSGLAGLLRSAHVTADPIPLATLRLMGLAPRRGTGVRIGPNGRSSTDFGSMTDATDFYRPMGGALFDGLEAFFEDGASVEVSYGLSDGKAPAADAGGHRRLEFRVAGDYGNVHFLATHDGQWLTGSRSESGEPALDAGFRLAKGKLVSVFRSLAPPEGLDIRDLDRNAKWYLRSDRFQLPLRATELSVANFFGSAVADSLAARAAGDSVSNRPAGAGWRRFLAQGLRRSDAQLQLYSHTAEAAKLVLVPSGQDQLGEDDRLDLTHRLTKITLSGELGAAVNSRWLVGQSGTYDAELKLSIPGAPLMPGDDLIPQLEVHMPALPVSLLRETAQLPEDLASLLPSRFDRLTLKGLSLPQLLAAKGAPRRPSLLPIQVIATINSSERVAGTYEGGVMTIPKATLTVPLERQFCEGIIKGYMPWFETVEPSDGGSLAMEFRAFAFSMGKSEFKQTGEVILRTSPLRVSLLPQITAKLTASDAEEASQDDDDQGLVAWTPAPTLLSLDGLRVGYEGIELPLSDSYTAQLDGSFYRGNGNFSLSGVVESHFIQGPEGSDALWLIAINGSVSEESTTAQVTFDPGTIDPNTITDLVRKATEIRDKVK